MMKNNFIGLSLFIIFIITKELLPISYEIVVILASILVFFYLKTTLTQVIFDFFNSTRNLIIEDFVTISTQANRKLNPNNFTKFSVIQVASQKIKIENIIVPDTGLAMIYNFDINKHLENLIISSINSVNSGYTENVVAYNSVAKLYK